MNGATWIGLGTLGAAVVGLSLVGWQLRLQRIAMQAEFGNLYIQRYWSIDDDLLIALKGSEEHRRHRHRYLRLFEDEFDVASLGFLNPHQWRAWHAVLDGEKALVRVKDDLKVCNPAEDEYELLRACIRQRDREETIHGVANCLGRKRR
jgi:hypothetical protein